MKRLLSGLQTFNREWLRVRNKFALAYETFVFGFMAFLCFLAVIRVPILIVDMKTRSPPNPDWVSLSYAFFPAIEAFLTLAAILGIGGWVISVIHEGLTTPNYYENRTRELLKTIAEYENAPENETDS